MFLAEVYFREKSDEILVILSQYQIPLNCDFTGKVVVVTGAGGNNLRATCDNEYQHEAREGGKSFFDLDPNGVDFLFKLNFQGTLLPTARFAKILAGTPMGRFVDSVELPGGLFFLTDDKAVSAITGVVPPSTAALPPTPV